MVRALVLLVAFTALAGCVERKMIIRSEPEGASVWVNRSERPLGTTTLDPGLELPFDQHGTFAVRLEKEDHLPLETEARVPTPWYSWPILDFITEVLWPFTIEDHHEFTFTLEKRPDPRPWEEIEAEVIKNREDVLKRAEEIRRETHEPPPVEPPSGEPPAEEPKDIAEPDAGPVSELEVPGIRSCPGWLDQ